MRVLVAEDDPAPRDVLVLGLEDHGYHGDAVERGDDAIDMLKFYDYDVAIIDWRMPGAEGIEVVAWARRNDKPTALLMLTARDAPPDRSRGLAAGRGGRPAVGRSPSTPGMTRPIRSGRTRSTSSSAACAPSCRRRACAS